MSRSSPSNCAFDALSEQCRSINFPFTFDTEYCRKVEFVWNLAFVSGKGQGLLGLMESPVPPLHGTWWIGLNRMPA
jgi:hypothetical protein